MEEELRDDNLNESIQELDLLRNKKNRKEKIYTLISLIAAISSIVAVSNFFFIRSLQERIAQRDDVIDAFLQSDTSAIRNIVKEESYFTVGDQEMNSKELVEYINSVLKHCYLELDSLAYYKEYYRITKDKIGATLELNPKDSTGQSYIYTYPSLNIDKIQVDSLYKESQRYRAIMKKYPIEVETGDGYFVISSPQIDSALLLLPYFRDNIKSLPNGEWQITYYTTQTNQKQRKN